MSLIHHLLRHFLLVDMVLIYEIDHTAVWNHRALHISDKHRTMSTTCSWLDWTSWGVCSDDVYSICLGRKPPPDTPDISELLLLDDSHLLSMNQCQMAVWLSKEKEEQPVVSLLLYDQYKPAALLVLVPNSHHISVDDVWMKLMLIEAYFVCWMIHTARQSP